MGKGVTISEFFTSQQVQRVTGVTLRRLLYWVNTGLISPTKSGKEWKFSLLDLIMVRTVKFLIDRGVSLQKVRRSVNWMRDNLGTKEPLATRLITDGNTIFQVYKQVDELIHAIDTLRIPGQGVFFVPYGQIIKDTEEEVIKLRKVA